MRPSFLPLPSATWNGQEAAFRSYLTVLAVGAYVLLDTGEGFPRPTVR